MPRYPVVPAIRIGRLAVDLGFHGRGLGAAMLADTTARAKAAAFMLVVDANDERAVAFYEHHGFRALAYSVRTLFLPIETARRALIGSAGCLAGRCAAC